MVLESIERTGGMVRVIKTLAGGDVVEEVLTPALALEALYSSLNGSEVRSLRIEWGEVSPANRDSSGGAFAAEWSVIGQ